MMLFAAPEIDGHGPPSYISRLSGTSHENWTFWLEVKHLFPAVIDVFLLHFCVSYSIANVICFVLAIFCLLDNFKVFHTCIT